jgi:hypothetical protein
MSRNQSTLEQLQAAMQNSGQSRYAISKATGLSPAALSRFASGERGLTFDSAEVLAGHLGYRIALVPIEAASKPSSKPTKRPVSKRAK